MSATRCAVSLAEDIKVRAEFVNLREVSTEIKQTGQTDASEDNPQAAEHVEDSLQQESSLDPASHLEAVVAERERLLTDKAELLDRLLRQRAEFENYRKRAERERAETIGSAGMDTVSALLPILDDFERALKSAFTEDAAGGQFAEGVALIYERLFSALKKQGLEPIESLGKPFDPNVHHAIETVPTEEAEDHSVFDELQRGYNFKGRLLRPAMVRVAVKPS